LRVIQNTQSGFDILCCTFRRRARWEVDDAIEAFWLLYSRRGIIGNKPVENLNAMMSFHLGWMVLAYIDAFGAFLKRLGFIFRKTYSRYGIPREQFDSHLNGSVKNNTVNSHVVLVGDVDPSSSLFGIKIASVNYNVKTLGDIVSSLSFQTKPVPENEGSP